MAPAKAKPTSYATLMALAYNVLGMAPFGLMSGDMVKASWPHIKPQECPRRGPCEDTLEFTVGKIYCQVIFGVGMLYAALLVFPGKTGRLAAMGCMILTMSKHIAVDGLIPPPPVMAMTAGVVVANLAAPGEWGKRAFVAYCLLNAFTFATNPLMVLQDTFPGITEGSEAFKLGAFCFEVIALYMVMAGIAAATPNAAYALAFSWQVGLSVLGKHVLIDKSGPPGPLIGLYLATCAMAWYEVGWSNFKPAAEGAIKAGPMKLHSIILATGFVPYFVAECVGFPFPMVGLASLDASYAYTGATCMLTAMLAIFLSMTAYTEFTGKMEGKLFAMYHYFLSVVCIVWQLQPSTTMLGAAFFAPPHMFTLWTVYVLFKETKMA